MIRLRRKQLVLDDIKRIQVNPGDALLFTSTGPLSQADAERIKARVESVLPGIKALIASHDFDVRVISGHGMTPNAHRRAAGLPPAAPPADPEARG